MRTVRVTLDANGYATAQASGTYVAVASVTNNDTFSITWLVDGGADRGTLEGARSGRDYTPGFTFTALQLVGTASDVVELVIASGDRPRAALQDAEVLVVNTVAERVPVDVGGGAINVTATMVELTEDGVNAVDAGHPLHVTGPLTDAQLRAAPVPVSGTVGLTPNTAATPWYVKDARSSTLTNVAPVVATNAATLLLAADNTRRCIMFRNMDAANPVALIAAAGTYANAAIVLLPGEMWRETDMAGAAWYGITSAGGLTATVNMISAT